ncbi:hypothetical protein [Nonomuraea rhodomycinica]|uniref:Uncharacterized protein n=1 Tax=Nonomuraea rhodomycinica TaxID=1712872 RepID=A0A7Y6IQV5_9ACTN|nr:hypothetical protein [Nonomuraea rhodomycinica]NUW42731.1 hypothetical protein [Nonomuraea rhodomycinica]
MARRAWLVWVSAGSVVLAGGVTLLGGGPLDGVLATAGEGGRGDGDRGAAPGVSRTAARALSPETGDAPHGATPGYGPHGATPGYGPRDATPGYGPYGATPGDGGLARPEARSTAYMAPPPAAPRGHGASDRPAADPATGSTADRADPAGGSTADPADPAAGALARPAATSTSRSAPRPASPSAARTPATRPSAATPPDGGARSAAAAAEPGGTATTAQSATEYFRARWGSGDDAAHHLTDIRTIGGYLRIYTDLPESAANSATALTLCYRGLEYLRRTGAAHPVVFVQARFGENGNPVLANILGPGDASCRVTHPDPN